MAVMSSENGKYIHITFFHDNIMCTLTCFLIILLLGMGLYGQSWQGIQFMKNS